MALKKKYLSFSELMNRWSYSTSDLHYLISEGELIPAIIWNDALKEYSWIENEKNNFSFQKISDEINFISDWLYLRSPRKIGVEKYIFNSATLEGYLTHHRKTLNGFKWFQLYQSVDNDLITETHINNEYIEKESVFMMSQISFIESFENHSETDSTNNIPTLQTSIENFKLAVRTENNYLRLIITLAHAIPEFDKHKPYEAAQKIIDETGITIAKQTIANYIKKAYELEVHDRQ